MAWLLLVIVNGHDAGIAFNGNGLTIFDALGAVTYAQYGGYSVFSGHNGAVGKNTAHIGYQADGVSEQLSPGWRCEWTILDAAGDHLV